MEMNLNVDITLDLKVSDLEGIIKEYISKQFPYYEVKSIDVKLGKRSVGYGYQESSEPYFKSFEVKLKDKQSKN
jgi:hypothetical protein